MVAKWILEYFTPPATWTQLAAKFNQTVEELNGHEEATITLANTSDNRALVAANKTVRISYDGHIIFTGQLAALDYGATLLKCVLYNECFETMKRKTITAKYTDVAASTILADICSAAGVTAGTCPSTPLSTRFNMAYCFDAATFLAQSLNSDYSSSGTTFNIAARGSLKTATNITIRSRGVDRSKKRDKVYVRGVDDMGLEVLGEAGSGTDVAVYTEKKASDKATLDALAAKYLAELNTESKGAPIVVPITEGYDFYPGDTIQVTNSTYNLDGTYKMMRVTKTSTRVTVELERAKQNLEELVLDVKKYADLGIYQVQPSQITPWALSLSGLVGLYHLTDGTVDPATTIAKDSSESANDGDITNGDWVNGVIPGTKVLNFDADGNVDTGTSTFNPGDTAVLSIGIWLSAQQSYGNGNYAIFKQDCFYIQHYSLDNKIRFGLKIDGAWSTLESDAGASPLWGRTFAVGVYDGSKMYLYVNGACVNSKNQTGTLDSNSNNVFLGHVFHGIIAEAMLWVRALSAQEVQELYFFPLSRVLRKGDAAASGWFLTCQAGTGGIISPSGLVNAGSGESLEVAATPQNSDWEFEYWLFDGEPYSTVANPVNIPPQSDLSYHALFAVFKQIGSELSGQVTNVNDGEVRFEEKFHLADAFLVDETWIREDAGKWAVPFFHDEEFSRVEVLDEDVPTGEFGNNATSATSTSCINAIVGSVFTSPASQVKVTNISAYILCTTANKNFKAAIYRHSDLAKVGESAQVAVAFSASAQRVVFVFPSSTPTLEASTEYLLVVWCSSASGSGAVYYTTGTTDQGHTRALTYGAWPNPFGSLTHNNNAYCLHATYYIL